MNKNNRGANTNTLQMLIDIAMLLLAFLIEVFIFREQHSETDTFKHFGMILTFGIIYILANKEARIYNVTLFFYFDRFFKIITKSWLFAAATTTMMLFFFNLTMQTKIHYFVYLILSYCMLAVDVVLSRFLRQMLQNSRAPRVAFVGHYEDYQKLSYFLNKTSIKIDQIGYIEDGERECAGVVNVLGNISNIEDVIRNCQVDQIYFIHKSDFNAEQMQKYIDICIEMGVTVKIVIDTFYSKCASSYVSSLGTYPVITYHTISLNNYEQVLKRGIDLLLSGIAILITLPLMLLTALVVKKSSDGPILLREMRLGQNGRSFDMLKFRTSFVNREEGAKEQLTRAGKIIRKLKMERLPRLFNVWEGSMSLVGAKAITPDEIEQYKRSQWRRVSIKPGLTGVWYLNKINKEGSKQGIQEDLDYIDNWSFWLDFKIVFKSIISLF